MPPYANIPETFHVSSVCQGCLLGHAPVRVVIYVTYLLIGGVDLGMPLPSTTDATYEGRWVIMRCWLGDRKSEEALCEPVVTANPMPAQLRQPPWTPPG